MIWLEDERERERERGIFWAKSDDRIFFRKLFCFKFFSFLLFNFILLLIIFYIMYMKWQDDVAKTGDMNT